MRWFSRQRCFATKSGNLSLIPKTHTQEEGEKLQRYPTVSTHSPWDEYQCIHTHTHNNNNLKWYFRQYWGTVTERIQGNLGLKKAGDWPSTLTGVACQRFSVVQKASSQNPGCCRVNRNSRERVSRPAGLGLSCDFQLQSCRSHAGLMSEESFGL